ncbi:SDR family NAD(P)-dependent oxidoreductase, partial [Streptomyces sp. NPDC052701]|uniref:SDR family NAD(P)-dependent oxidoreductase n=1 Tax=Streptomyces sp. NPDC052701 TaxID=3155533 RepID=UPI0034227758
AGLGRRVSRLRVSHAFHSPLMEPMLEDFRAVVAQLAFAEPSIPVVSNVSGTVAAPGELTDPEYWVGHVRKAVRFADGITALRGRGVTRFVECGPDAVLTGLARQILDEDDEDGGEGIVFASVLRRDRPEDTTAVTALAELFVSGAEVDWDGFYAGRNVTRVDLPTYAFQRKHYWAAQATVSEANEAGSPVLGSGGTDSVDAVFWDAVERRDSSSLAEELDVPSGELGPVVDALAAWREHRKKLASLDSLRYRVDWKPVGRRAVDAGKRDETWLVVRPPAGLRGETVERIVDALVGEVTVIPFEVVDSDRAALTERIRTEVAAVGPHRVLSLLGLDDRPHAEHPSLTHGAAATVVLAQALADAGTPAPLWCVTSGAVAVQDSAELVSPSQSALWGLGAGLGLDQPQSWGGLIDVPENLDDRALGLFVAALRADDDEDQLAVRAGGVFARRMVRSPLAVASGTVRRETSVSPSSTPEDGQDSARRRSQGGTVFITGGTGGLGAHVARMFAEDGAEHLVLTSRRGPAAEGADALTKELESLGARVTVAACDVADREALAALLASLSDGPPLRTVVHAAGLPQRIAALPELNLEEFAEVGRAKTLGARYLDELLGDTPLDAFVLFSSGSAVWGSSGQAAYGSANAFLDGLCHRRRARGLTATSVAWGSWDGGMVDAELSAVMRRMGAPAMAPDIAVSALRQALEHDESHLVVADFDWSRFTPAYTLARPRPLLDEIPEAVAALDGGAEQETSADAPALAARLVGMPRVEATRAVHELVRSHVAALLGYDDALALDTRRAFDDLGFDSVAAVDLRGRLTKATGRKLPSTMIFDYANPAALSDFLLTELLPAPTGPELSALEQLERMETALTGLGAREIETERIVTRLRSLASRLTEIVAAAGSGVAGTGGAGATAGAGTPDVGQKLESASADDVFDFIDKELGLT